MRSGTNNLEHSESNNVDDFQKGNSFLEITFLVQLLIHLILIFLFYPCLYYKKLLIKNHLWRYSFPKTCVNWQPSTSVYMNSSGDISQAFFWSVHILFGNLGQI